MGVILIIEQGGESMGNPHERPVRPLLRESELHRLNEDDEASNDF